MDHITHSALLWIVVGSAVPALFLWITMLSSSAGHQLDAELDRLLSAGSLPGTAAGDTQARIRSVAAPPPDQDRFRLLGDPEYGLFLDDSAAPPAPVSAA
jgi:hypothetical protein